MGGPPQGHQPDAAVEAYLAELAGRDPGFVRGPFLRECQGLFEDVTRAWAALDADRSRPWMLEHLWHGHREGIAALRDEGFRPVVEHLAVLDARVVGAWLEDGWDCLLVRFTASSTDYKLDRRGRPTDDTGVRTWQEEWTVAKPWGDVTPGSVPPGARCPSCGAPGEGSVRCPYCGQLRTEGRGFREVWKAASIDPVG